MRTGIVGQAERPDDELSRMDGFNRAADLFDDAAIFVAHRHRRFYVVQARNGQRSEPQMQEADRRMMASVGLRIFGSGTSSQRTSRGPCKIVPSIRSAPVCLS